MRLLLDTHIFLWILDDSPRLSQKAREMMTGPATECFVSAVSLWEIAIKASLRRDEFRVDVAKLLTGARAAGLKLLAFQPEHAVRVARLAKHHSDPFDRALVAQALTEPLTLVTRDAALAPYGRTVIVV
jgi:PIN domain nuclease of toxin-antitoxin system